MISSLFEDDSNAEEAPLASKDSSLPALKKLRNRMRKVEIPSGPFSDLPDDCVVHLCAHFLNPIHIERLGSTCRKNKFVLENNSIWRQQVERDHGLQWREWENGGGKLRDGPSFSIADEDMHNPGQYRKIYKHLAKYQNILEADESDPPVQRDAIIKILMIGDGGVGKTSLLRRFVHDDFSNSFHNTIGVDFFMKSVKTRSDIAKKWHVRLQVWDTAGRERFMTVTRSYYRGAHVILIVFSLADRYSFQSVKRWYAEIQTSAPAGIVVHLVGNKSDEAEKRQVTETEAQELAQELKIKYFETSAKSGAGVQSAFLVASSAALRKIAQAADTALDLQAGRPAPQPQASKGWISSAFSRIAGLFT